MDRLETHQLRVSALRDTWGMAKDEDDGMGGWDTAGLGGLEWMKEPAVPDWIANPVLTHAIPDALQVFDFEPSTTPEDTLDAVTRSAEHAAKQTELLAALSNASAEQVQTLAAMRKLSEELASERRRSAAREDIQQGFNRRMSWAALLLAGAAVIVPFSILWIEQAIS